MQQPITIEIVETPKRPGKFTARLGDRIILKSSHQPLLDAARILLAEGMAPEARIAMRHAGSPHVALSATVGAAARLTVEDGQNGRPRFRAWKPHSFGAVRCPSDFPAGPLPTPTPGAGAEKNLGIAGGSERGRPLQQRPVVRP